jgi:hypothetical protein
VLEEPGGGIPGDFIQGARLFEEMRGAAAGHGFGVEVVEVPSRHEGAE